MCQTRFTVIWDRLWLPQQQQQQQITAATATPTVKKMSSTNLGDLKTNELGISHAAFDGLGSTMNETTASTTVASNLKTVESAVPHAAFDGAFEGPGSKMNETAASSYVANMPVHSGAN
jgi:hypothetical protein